MNSPLFITTEKKQASLPLLIVDKPAILSRGLVSVLSEHFMTVLVSQKQPLSHLSRIIHVPFKRTIPAIPDNYFSAILIFYNGERALVDSLPSFIKKAQQNNAKILMVTSRKHSSEPFIAKGMEVYDNLHIAVYGDIFGISRSEDSLVTHMIHEAHLTQKIVVHGTGLSETYPVYYADVLQGILHMLLSHHAPRVGLLFPTSGVTEIHLARLVLKYFPQADLSFAKTGEEKKERIDVPLGEVLLTEPYSIADKIKHLKRSALNGPPGTIRKRKKTTSPAPTRAVLFFLTTSICLALFSLSTFLFFFLGLFTLHNTVQTAKEGGLEAVKQKAIQAKGFFSLAEDTSGLIVITGSAVGFHQQADYYVQNIRSGKTAATIAETISNAGMTYKNIADGKSSNPQESMLAVSSDLKHVLLDLSRLQAEQSLPQTYAAQLAAFKKPLEQLSGIIDVLPELTGVGKEQRYVVLFQNNAELRAGGGFIGSYGILTLHNGAMKTFTIHDVYDADGQLTGHVDPPYYLRRYLGSTHLFLRDSNFDVEFSENAAMAAALLQASTGEVVDGVITMDVSFMRTLLSEIGPVYVPAFDETVSAKNFYQLAQAQAEENFIPGSNQKQDFLQHVARAMILSLQDREQLPYVGLLKSLQKGISEKHVMVTSANPETRRLLATNGFAPSVRKTFSETSATVSDFLGVFESNVGLNKANYYIKRGVTQDIVLQATGERTGVVTLKYTNTSTQNSPYGGDYKPYVQLVLEQDTVITGITINGTSQILVLPVTSERVYSASGFVAPSGLELMDEQRLGRSVFGFPLTIPMGQEQTIQISYKTTQETPLSDSFSYILRVFKQPGTDYDPYKLTLTYDPSFQVVSAPGFVSQTQGKLRVTSELGEDILVPLRFVK